MKKHYSLCMQWRVNLINIRSLLVLCVDVQRSKEKKEIILISIAHNSRFEKMHEEEFIYLEDVEECIYEYIERLKTKKNKNVEHLSMEKMNDTYIFDIDENKNE